MRVGAGWQVDYRLGCCGVSVTLVRLNRKATWKSSGRARSMRMDSGFAFSNRDGPFILCLHGFPDHARSFRHQLRTLSAHGYRVVAPNMRGYLSSEIPSDGSYQLAVLGQEAVSLIGALGYRFAVVFGYDFAAGAAYAAALIAPEKSSELIAASGSCGATVSEFVCSRFRTTKALMAYFLFSVSFC